MLNIDFLQEILIISMTLSSITCALVQKTKTHFTTSKFLPLYSLLMNTIIGLIFCASFTDITFPISLWVGFFSFIGADTIYKTLEGKILSHSDIIARKKITISKENIINEEEKI